MSKKFEDYALPEAKKREIEKVLPQEHADYFAAIHDKHFNNEKAVGSLFTEVRNLNELLEKVIAQRGSLDGDDREKFIEMGIPETAFIPQCRYLKVETMGRVGIIKLSKLPPETIIRLIRTKPKAPCSLVAEWNEFPEVDFGTIIIGPNKKERPEDPEPSTKEMIWTAYPGLPVQPATKNYWPEGSEITVQDLIDRLVEDIYINVQKKK